MQTAEIPPGVQVIHESATVNWPATTRRRAVVKYTFRADWLGKAREAYGSREAYRMIERLWAELEQRWSSSGAIADD